ncbi:hypothetical protein GW869_00200 [bacterium]|nr:hypothetical protein [bacterium]
MTDAEAEMAVKTHALVGTSNVTSNAGFCLYSAGYLQRRVKEKGQKKQQFLFRDRFGEIEAARPASAFTFIR